MTAASGPAPAGHHDVVVIGGGPGGTTAAGLAGTGGRVLPLNDFHGPGGQWEYPMGSIQMPGKSGAWRVKSQAAKGTSRAPSLPGGFAASHAPGFWLAGEDLPLPGRSLYRANTAQSPGRRGDRAPGRRRPLRRRPGRLRARRHPRGPRSAHDPGSLCVAGGAFMPSTGAVNPALTITANAVRVAGRIAARLAG